MEVSEALGRYFFVGFYLRRNMKKLMKLKQMVITRMRRTASENFLSMRKRFLDPKNQQ